jgi:mRNA interferase MazF
VKRGEIWTAAAGTGYVGKPRPVVIVQSDRFDGTESVTVCAFTTVPYDAPLLRIHVEADSENGLRTSCNLMVDKVTTVPRSKLGEHVGVLSKAHLAELERLLLVFLGLVR